MHNNNTLTNSHAYEFSFFIYLYPCTMYAVVDRFQAIFFSLPLFILIIISFSYVCNLYWYYIPYALVILVHLHAQYNWRKK